MHVFHHFQVTLDTAPIKNPTGIYHPAATSPAVILDGITNTQAQVIPSILPLKVSTYKFNRKSGLFHTGNPQFWVVVLLCSLLHVWYLSIVDVLTLAISMVSSSVAPTAAFSFQPLRSFTMDSVKYQQEILLAISKWKKQKNIYQANALVPAEDKSSSCHEVSPWLAHKADNQWL